jgi:TldD protein
MRALAESTLNLLPRDVEYADVRVVNRRHEGVHVENGRVGQVIDEMTEGIALRALVHGQWGFAATAHLDAAGVSRVVEVAVAQARAARGLGPRARLAPAEPVVGRFETPVERDPFLVPAEEKLELLLAASSAMLDAGGAAVRFAEASVDAFRETKVFASTEGTLLEQVLTETGGGIMATAVDADDLQRRSFPQSVPRAIRGQRGDFATAGWEHVLSLGLLDEAPRVGEEAVALLTAATCPTASTTLIVSGTQMAQLVHETVGHPAELDRALGSEASLAGGSFMEPELRGRLRFGSDLVSVTADATLRGGLGSFAWDDEGVPSQRTPIVRDGTFVGYLTSRESAGALGEPSSGAARADGWARIPLVRMSNVSLEPGETPFEEIIESTDEGLLFDMNRSLSIDDTRRAFRFGCEIGWEIRGGRRGRMLKNCTFSGETLAFWRSCDAVADAGSWRVYGIPSCNKGEPLQVAHIGHGTVPARFREVRVGV